MAEFGEARDDGAASTKPVRGGPGADCGFQLEVSVQCKPTLVTREFTDEGFVQGLVIRLGRLLAEQAGHEVVALGEARAEAQWVYGPWKEEY